MQNMPQNLTECIRNQSVHRNTKHFLENAFCFTCNHNL